jgi:hypothetical protein
MLDWFPRRYALEVLDRAPLIAPSRSYIFPKRVEEIERGALHVLVRPNDGDKWLGIFALGYASPHTITGVYSTPNPDCFLALSGGYAYFVDASAPERTQFLPQQPILWIGYSVDPAVVLLADHHAITAVNANGVAWQTPSLSMEGLTDLRVVGNVLYGKGWDAISDEEHGFQITLGAKEFVIV